MFDKIYRYREREGRSRKEDFFTEVLVAVLTRCKPFQDRFIDWLFDKYNISKKDLKSIRFETQKTLENRRPDIYIEVEGKDEKQHVAIIENKIDSGEGVDQLTDYQKILRKHFPNVATRMLFYLTKNPEKPSCEDSDDVKFKHYRWYELYKTLEGVEQECSESIGDLGPELLRLMRDWKMDNRLSAAQIRAAIVCFDDKVGARLHGPQNDAWDASGIEEVISETDGKWSYDSKKGGQTSSVILPYKVRLWMGYRFDRRDADWNVDQIELPSPYVTLSPEKDYCNDHPLPEPPEHWTGPLKDVRNWETELWVRQPHREQVPKHGGSIYDYYKEFFSTAFSELKQSGIFKGS